MSILASDEELGIGWSDPAPLDEAVRGGSVPALAGLYRIRRIGMKGWDYIGQTGSGDMNLRRRMAMLQGIYRKEMPYRDPHTAGRPIPRWRPASARSLVTHHGGKASKRLP